MPFLTPAYPFDPALIDASLRDAARRDQPSRETPRPTPHIAFPAIDGTPVVLGGVLRSDSPFLDALPFEAPSRDPIAPEGHARDGYSRDAYLRDGYSHDGYRREIGSRTENERLWPVVPPAEREPTEPRPVEVVAPEVLGADASVPEAPFDRAAVARASARAARRVERVEATIMTDDGVAEHVCDVAAWLAGATVREIDALMQASWTGDAAAALAADLVDDDPEVADVLRHASRAESDVIVEIDGDAAMAWLARHRPSVADALADASSDADDAE